MFQPREKRAKLRDPDEDLPRDVRKYLMERPQFVVEIVDVEQAPAVEPHQPAQKPAAKKVARRRMYKPKRRASNKFEKTSKHRVRRMKSNRVHTDCTDGKVV